MNWNEVAPLLALLGVFCTLVVTILNTKQINKFNKDNSLLLASFDRRLQAHQEAFANCQKIWRSVNQTTFDETAKNCNDWWNSNCLFLDPEVRQAYLNVVNVSQMENAYRKTNQDPGSVDGMKEFFEFAKILFEKIKLPMLTNEEVAITSKK